jgi:hypothetical protein
MGLNSRALEVDSAQVSFEGLWLLSPNIERTANVYELLA